MNPTEMFTRNVARAPFRIAFAVAAVFCLSAIAYAGPIGLTINATFDPSLDGTEQAAIDAAISNIEASITSPHNITVSIYFDSMTGGLGESDTSEDNLSYYNYYNAYKAVATSPAQLAALASLGTAPTPGSGNPVNGNSEIIVTTAEARNLGFTGFETDASILVNGSDYDSEISLNTGITSPPNSLSGNYSLQSVATHEIDEALGIGGTGSSLTGTGSLTGPVGDLDLYRYSAPGVRSYSNDAQNQPYFSINGGETVLSYFNQEAGADFADWQTGSQPQVQDAFGTPGASPVLGPNELTAFNAIGYELIAPEPSTFALVGLGLLGFGLVRRRQSANR